MEINDHKGEFTNEKAIVLIGMTALLAISSAAFAAEKPADESNTVEITTSDGVLSIEMSGDEWAEKTDSDYWFEITDGKNSIVIDHFGYGEDLPDVKMAAEEYEGVYQAFISTKNEVFIVTGLADSREHLDDVMQTIGTIRVLKYDTKTAVQKETQAAVNAAYYVTADELNVRSDHSADSKVLGALYKGEAVTVIGAVTNDATDTGWYQIRYKDKIGYVSSSFLSQAAPAGTAGGTDQSGQSGGTDQSGQSGQSDNSGKIQCERCGQWFSPDELRDHQLGHTMDDMNAGN